MLLGELFRLAARKMRPELPVAMAANGAYGPAYLGTTVADPEESADRSSRASNVAPPVEPHLMDAIKRLLGTRK